MSDARLNGHGADDERLVFLPPTEDDGDLVVAAWTEHPPSGDLYGHIVQTAEGWRTSIYGLYEKPFVGTLEAAQEYIQRRYEADARYRQAAN
jgi:hypothetical protein